MSTSELASSYAALILADDGIEITVSCFPNIPSSRISVPAQGQKEKKKILCPAQTEGRRTVYRKWCVCVCMLTDIFFNNL